LGVREIVNTISIENIQSVIHRSYLRHHVNNKLSVTENKVIGFMSAKGGDGGSCVASNLATALANLSKLKFLILDLSLPFGDIEMFLTNKKRIHDLSDFADEIERLDSPLMASMATHLSDNLDLIPSPESVDRLIRIKPEYIDRIIDIAKNSYDYVLVDIGAGIDPISIHALGKLDQLNVIATLSVPSFKRATQVITYCHELGFDRAKFKLIINRFEKSSDIGVDDFNKATGEKVSRILPQDNSGVKESLLKGIPLVNLKPNSDFTKAILDWSRDWLGLPHERSIWHRLRIK
jgi:pilus assembly protein CpaE